MKPYQAVHLDIGTGDGTYIFHKAREYPHEFFIGVDSNAENMCDRSRQAAKNPKKGGLPNVLFVHAPVEAFPSELTGIASHITIFLPWGSLLKAALGLELVLLENIACLARSNVSTRSNASSNTSIRVIVGFDQRLDSKIIQHLNIPELNKEFLDNHLKPTYFKAGFKVEWSYLKQDELKNLKTTWAKKLAYGKERQFIEIKGTKII